MLDLPISELGFNVILWVLITIYGATGIGNFIARTPDPKIDDEDELFRFNSASYIFRLLTSLIFLFFGISQFENQTLVYLTVVEIIIVLIAYMYLIIAKNIDTKHQMEKLREIRMNQKQRIQKGY